MDADFVKLVSSNFGDIYDSIERLITLNNDVDFTKLFKRVRDFLFAHIEERRKSDINNILIDIHVIYCKLFCFRHPDMNYFTIYENYTEHLVDALPRIVHYSFTLEYRKLQILFGLVNTLAELLIHDLQHFGYHADCGAASHASDSGGGGSRQPACACRVVRRSIGNALINLTYRQRDCKLSLCANAAFLDTVTNVVGHIPFLAQCYAGLIRNLSWNTDEAVARQALAQTVPALTQASLSTIDQKCRLALLSALWNLAPHSVQNKRAMCSRHDFLSLLAHSLDDLRQNAILESASGVLKYLCSYIKDDKSLRIYLIGELKIVPRLLRLLQSSTFTAIVNSLGALTALISQDPSLQIGLIRDVQAMRLIGHLRRTNREDVSNAAKTLLDNLYDSAYHHKNINYNHYSNECKGNDSINSFISVSGTNYYSQTLNARSEKQRSRHHVNPNGANPKTHRISENPINACISQYYASNTIPRAIKPAAEYGNENYCAEVNRINYDNGAQLIEPYSREPIKMTNENVEISSTQSQQQFSITINTSNFVMDDFEDEKPSDSMLVTKANSRASSKDSLNEIQHSGEWPSTVNTEPNSGLQSPASYSDLPDSPSQCGTLLKDFNTLKVNVPTKDNNLEVKQLQKASKPQKQPQSAPSSSSRTLSNSLSLATVGKQSSRGSTVPENNDVDEGLLSDMINSVMPKQHPRKTSLISDKEDDFLNECITAAMPQRGHDPFDVLFNVANDSSSLIDWDDSQTKEPFNAVLSLRQNPIRAQVRRENNFPNPIGITEAGQFSAEVLNTINMAVSSSSDDNYNLFEACAVDAQVPDDVDAQFRAALSGTTQSLNGLATPLAVNCGKTASYSPAANFSTLESGPLANNSPTKAKKPSAIPRKTRTAHENYFTSRT